MKMMDPDELEDVELGTEVMLVLKDGGIYSGRYNGMDGEETIMLKSMSSESVIGFPLDKLQYFMRRE